MLDGRRRPALAAEALEVLAHILGNGSNSRLYRALVVDKQVAVAAGAWYDASMLDLSRFAVSGSPRPGATLPQLEAEIDAVIAEFRSYLGYVPTKKSWSAPKPGSSRTQSMPRTTRQAWLAGTVLH